MMANVVQSFFEGEPTTQEIEQLISLGKIASEILVAKKIKPRKMHSEVLYPVRITKSFCSASHSIYIACGVSLSFSFAFS